MSARPRGVTYLALVLGLLGLLGLLAIPRAFSLAVSGTPVATFYALLSLVIPQVMVAAAVGLWRLKRWGFLAAGVALILIATSSLMAATGPLATAGPAAPQWVLFGLAVVALGYLMTPRVRAAFARE